MTTQAQAHASRTVSCIYGNLYIKSVKVPEMELHTDSSQVF